MDDKPEAGLIKRTPIDSEDDEDYEDATYVPKEYIFNGEEEEEEYSNVPSIINQVKEEESHSEEAEREALEKKIIKKLQRDRDPVGNIDYHSNGPVDPEEERRAIRVLLRQDDSIDGMKKIADKFSIDMKRVLAIKDEMEEEKKRMEHEQAILMQQRMMEIKNPEIPMKMIIGRHLGGQGMTVSLIGK